MRRAPNRATNRVMRGTVHHLHVASDALRGNALGDPTDRDLFVYEPPGAAGPLPTVYLLAAFAGDGRSFLDGSPLRPSVVDTFDRAVVEGRCPPARLAMPDASNRLGGSQYLDSEATGRYQTFLADEIIPTVDARFETLRGPHGRVVAGRSSGGFGALRLALDRPGLVGAVVAHAPDAAFDLSLRPSLLALAVAVTRYGGRDAFLAAMRDAGPGAADFDALFALAATAAYAPRPATAWPFCEFPVDEASGAVIEPVFDRLRAHDPVELLARRREAPEGLVAAFIDAGSGDEHGLAFGARALARAFEALGVDVAHTLHPGGHRGTSHRFAESLPWALGRLGPR